MSKEVSVAEAKQSLTQLLRDANKSHEEIIVTFRGTPFMVILPYEEFQQLERVKTFINMVHISEGLKDEEIPVNELIQKSRKELEERL